MTEAIKEILKRLLNQEIAFNRALIEDLENNKDGIKYHEEIIKEIRQYMKEEGIEENKEIQENELRRYKTKRRKKGKIK